VTLVSIFGSSAPQIYIRGVGSNDVNPSANPGIAAYQNETYLASPLGQNLALFDLDRIEILRGPQGTLFGRNATGGTLIVHTRQPDARRTGKVAFSLGSFGQRDIEANLNTGGLGPFRARLAGFDRKSDGWTKNSVNGASANGQDAAGGRLTLTAELSPNWDINLALDYAVDRSGMTAHSGLGIFEPPSLLAPSVPGSPPRRCDNARIRAGVCSNILGYVYSKDPSYQSYDRDDREYLDVGGLSLTFARSGKINFRTITSYRGERRSVREDTDASPLAVVALDFNNSSRAFTQEFLFSGTRAALTWRVGAFALSEQLSTTNRFETLGSLRALGVRFIPDPIFFAFGPFRLSQRYQQTVRSEAIFSEADFAASPKLTLTAGARLTSETTKFRTETLFAEMISDPVLSPSRNAKSSNDAISWRLAARYEFARGQNAYATISRGFKSGGFNGGALFASDTIGPLDPEFVTAYETGVKWKFSPTLSAELAIFRYDYSDLQDFTIRATPPPSRQILDSADAQMSGADLNVQALMPLGFSLRSNISLLKARYTNFIDANEVDRAGNNLPISPRLSTNIALQWNGPITDRISATARLTVDQRSQVFFDNTNDALMSSPETETFAASINLEDQTSGWRLGLSGENLTNERTLIAALNIANYGFIQQTFARPKRLQVTLSQSF
jgi:iron complex outermembrane recepter protein